jgi:hypothetical protein
MPAALDGAAETVSAEEENTRQLRILHDAWDDDDFLVVMPFLFGLANHFMPLQI